MLSAKEIINSFFNNENSYDEWQEMRSDTKTQIRRSEVNQERFRSSGNSTETLLFWDLRLLRYTSQDYDDVMQRIIDGSGTFDEEIIKDNRAVLVIVLHIVELENNVLDAAFVMGVMKIGIVMVPLTILSTKSNLLQNAIINLKIQLQKAKEEMYEAIAKAALSFAIDGILLLSGPVGLLAQGGIFLGKLVLSDLIGGPEQSTAENFGDKASESVDAYGEALSETQNVSARTQSFGKGAGKVAKVAGFAFDANEVLTGYRNVEKIEQLQARAKHAMEELEREITRQKPKIEQFFKQYKRWIVSIKDEKRVIENERRELLDFRKTSPYKVPA